MRCRVFRTSPKRSPCRRTRSSTTSIVNEDGSRPSSTSSQRSGVDTGAPGSRPHGVCGGDRLAFAVLVRVDQHACAASPSTTLSSPARDGCARPRRRRSRRTRACRRRCSGARPGRGRASRPHSRSSGTRRGRARRAPRCTISATCTVSLKVDVGRRVEVEEDEVGAVGLVDPRVPRVHVDAAHVHHPEERVLVVHDRRLDPLLARRRVTRRDLRAEGAGSSRACASVRPSGRTPCRMPRRDTAAS